MGTEAKPARLLDFLYRDPDRVASYCAQLFRGYASSIETSAQSKDVKDGTTGIGGPAWLFSGGRKWSREGAEGYKEVAVPHDMAVTDLLAKLAEEGRISADPGAAAAGSLVQIAGTLAMVDGSGLRVAAAGLEAAPDIANKSGGPKRANPKYLTAEQRAIKAGIAAFREASIPSQFLLAASSGTYFGTIKDAGLDEPVVAFLFKHGDRGLPGVTVVGIKEGSEVFPTLAEESLLQAGRSVMALLSKMSTPDAATPITPLVIYRSPT